jgi:hypothetical protein
MCFSHTRWLECLVAQLQEVNFETITRSQLPESDHIRIIDLENYQVTPTEIILIVKHKYQLDKAVRF